VLTGVLVVTNVLLLAFAISMGMKAYRVAGRAELRLLSGEPRQGALPRVTLEEFDGVFTPDEMGPTLATEVAFIGATVLGGTSDFEAWILAVLAKRSAVMFEFGTCTGKTAYLWARNLPPEGLVYTLTLAPDQLTLYQHAEGDNGWAAVSVRQESVFTTFRYSGTAVEHKVVQLYGDSKAFDEGPFEDRCDVVFVDGSHGYSYVRSDSAKALRMVKPGGVVLWHDYSGPDVGHDVYRALNDLARTLPIVHLAGTTLVAYRKPTTDDSE
jgi:predicted O-methyltransferase YrrM